MRAHLTVTLPFLPEMIAALRKEIADTLREVAQHEDSRSRERMLAVAAAFECGQSLEANE